jgi:hypothetical protein
MTEIDKKYPCKDCGVLRTKAEGGTVFSMCDKCWDKYYKTDKEIDKDILERATRLVNDLNNSAEGHPVKPCNGIYPSGMKLIARFAQEVRDEAIEKAKGLENGLKRCRGEINQVLAHWEKER